MMPSECLLRKQIADQLGVSESTIKAHVWVICRNSASKVGRRRRCCCVLSGGSGGLALDLC